MNREIKFRAYDEIKNIMHQVEISMDGTVHYWDEEDKVLKILGQLEDSGIFKKVSVMQYTGLKDKDGTEIYENDVVMKRAYNGIEADYNLISIVIFDKGNFCLKCIGGNEKSGTGFLHSFSIYSGNDLTKEEIIGNIHQNPELLGEE